jgi:hypothetical protein
MGLYWYTDFEKFLFYLFHHFIFEVRGGGFTVCGTCVAERHHEKEEEEKPKVTTTTRTAPPVKQAVTPMNPSIDVPRGTILLFGEHKHPLVRRGVSSTFGCDSKACGGEKPSDKRLWECTRCGTSFTVCGTCVLQNSAPYYDPPDSTKVCFGGHEHPLIREGKLFECDGYCKTSGTKSGDERQWPCSVCGPTVYTACGACVASDFCDEEIPEKKLEGRERTKINELSHIVADLERSVDRFRDDIFFDQWESYLNIRGALATDPFVGNCVEVRKALQKYTFKAEAAQKGFQQEAVTRRAEDEMRPIRHLLDEVKDKIWRCDFEGALERIIDAKNKVALLQAEPDYCVVLSVASFIMDCNARIREQDKILQEKVLERELENEERVISDLISTIKQDLYQSNEEQALLDLQKALGRVSELEQKSQYKGHPVTERIFARTDVELTDLNRQVQQKIFERALYDAGRDVTNKMGDLSRSLDIGDTDAAVGAFQAVRAQLEEFSIEFEGQAQIATFTAELKQNKERYDEIVLSKELYDAKHVVTSALHVAKEDLDHLRFDGFLKFLNQARGDLCSLSENSELAGLKGVEEFMLEKAGEIKALATKYEEINAARANEDALREINMAVHLAKEELNHHRHEAALKYIQSGFSKITEALCDPAISIDVEEPRQELQKLGEALTAEIEELDASNLARRRSDLIGMAEQDVEHGRYESMIKNLNDLRDTDPTNTDIVERMEKVRKLYREKVVSSEVASETRAITDLFSMAQDALKKSNFESALTNFQAVRRNLAKLAGNSEYGDLVTDFVAKQSAESEAFAKELKMMQVCFFFVFFLFFFFLDLLF